MNNEQLIIGGTYKHFKGKTYRVLDIARNSDNCKEVYVVYESLSDSDYPAGTVWIRPIEQFIDIHPCGKKRFVYENILYLTLKKKWYDMILSGEKTQEYRDIKPYWTKRLEGKHYTHVVFRNGYTTDSPSFKIELLNISRGIGDTKQGAPNYKVYILELGSIV